jgi:hypothetical protein
MLAAGLFLAMEHHLDIRYERHIRYIDLFTFF